MPRLLTLLALLTLLLPGCGITAKKMDPAAAQRIHTIALLDVAVTKERVYVDPAAMVTSSLILGDIGALGTDLATARLRHLRLRAFPLHPG